jgi:sodium-dependent dicarboxylate transporter 2/3/5
MNRVSYDTDVISGNNNIFVDEYHDLGSMTLKEKLSLIIISLTVFLWIFKSYISDFINISLSDSNIAIFGAILFFILPTGKDGAILKKDWFKSIPWNILILFGGGLSLASLVTSSGLASWLGESLFFLKDFHLFLIIILIALLISFLTEVTSNTATTLLFLPIIIAFAVSNQLDFIILALPVVIAASCAFMMPIATPPNAIIFSTNAIKISFMVSNGFKMNLVAILISSLWIYFFSFILIS